MIQQYLMISSIISTLVTGSHTEQYVVDYFNQSRSLLGGANFNLRSWASNGVQLTNVACTHNVAETTNPVRVLGLWWDTHPDLLYSSPKTNTTMFTMMATKGEILKWASSIFDPLGLISPVTIAAKLFLQQLWQ